MTVMPVRTGQQTTVIVTEAGGRERHYPRAAWRLIRSYGVILLELEQDNHTGEAETIATYAPGAWLAVRGADTDAPDATVRALGLARHALKEVGEILRVTPMEGAVLAGHPWSAALDRIAETVQIAQGRIFAEVDA